MDPIVEDIPENEKPSEIKSPLAEARTDPIAHLAIAQRFNIDTPSKIEEGQLAEVWAYAKSVAKSENIPDIIWEVIHLEGVLGSPKLGESRLDRLYRYCKIKRQTTQLENELKGVVGV